MFHGWPLVGVTALVTAAWCGAVLWRVGLTETGLHLVLLGTARESALLFLAAFLASALRSRFRNRATGWLLRNRRYVGVSFAVSHAFHLAAIFANGAQADEAYPALTIAFGGLGYAFVAAMASTSSDRALTALGSRRWRALHLTGMYYLWTIFVVILAGAAQTDPVSMLFLVAFVAALPTRILWRRRVRQGRDGAAH